MTSLKGFNKYFRTSNATATAKDIRDGKTAYAGDEKITGVMADDSNVLLEFEYPKGTGAFTPTAADCRVFNSGITAAGFAEMQLQSDGFAYADTAGANWMFNSGHGSGKMPAKTTNTRLYEVWGRYESTTLDDFTGVNIHINKSDASNWWQAYMQWYSGKFDPYIAQFIATAWNYRAAPLDITIGAPMLYHMQLYDHGDTLVQVVTGIRNVNQDSYQTVDTKYYTASRTDATVQTATFSVDPDGTNKDYFTVRGFRISDI